jgi:biotin carboxyl carrier protein
MKKILKFKDKEYEIEIEKISENFIVVKVNQKKYFFDLEKEEPEILEEEILKKEILETIAKKEKEEKIKELKAPLPGEISAIFVKEGDFVNLNQRLLCIVSMKMENEILSPTEGKIKEVKVKVGQKVQKDDLLIVFENEV